MTPQPIYQTDHRVDVIFTFFGKEKVAFTNVRRWEYVEAHEGHHDAQWVVNIDPGALHPEIRGTYHTVPAASVLFVTCRIWCRGEGRG